MQWATFQKLTVLKFTVFSLPWLLISIFLAFWDPALSAHAHLSPSLLLYMLVALSAARVAGMSFNRLIDHQQDSQNSRTMERVLPAEEASRGSVIRLAFGSVALFLCSASLINSLCFLLAIPIACLLWLYSYAKYYTPLCHFVMSLNQALIPLCVLVALTGSISPSAVWMAFSIFLLIGANDVIYAIQDVAYDRKAGIHSLPSSIGVMPALRIAYALHLILIGALLVTCWLAEAPMSVYLGVALAGLFLLYQDSQVDVKDNRSILSTSFASNAVVPMILLAFVFMEWSWLMW